MCGINGIYNFSNLVMPDANNLIRYMNSRIHHRGPDDSGVWSDYRREVFLGHQRLSIIDLTHLGHQPMVSKQGTVIVYNGEIYNFKSLKDHLKNINFVSGTDTEVLLYLYEKEGKECLSRLNGMFAFAVWDSGRRQLFLARDEIGKKPLYYTIVGGIFAFSSEIKSLLNLPWIKPQLDEVALYEFLTFNSLDSPQTMFKDIFKFHPGYYMVVDERGIKEYNRYWEVNYRNLDDLSEDDLVNLVRNDLDRSVKMRMVSDVPVGAFLSGGVDSSAVVAFMSNYTAQPLKTYSIGFKDAPKYDELHFSRIISKKFQTDHFEKIVTPEDIIEFLPKIVEIYDEPLADATSIPIYFISKMARDNGSIVVLTGDGADELFCGYRSWVKYLRLYPYFQIYGKIPKNLKTLIVNLYKHIDDSSPIHEYLIRASKGQSIIYGYGGIKESGKRSILNDFYNKKYDMLDSYERVERIHKNFEDADYNGRRKDGVDWLCYAGLKDSIPNNYLYRADRMGMANSIEIRTPFLDRNIVDLAMSISGKWKVHNGEPKYILKKSLEKHLPSTILYRKKMGFCVPLREWIDNYILDYINKNLRGFCNDTGIFKESGVREQIQKTKTGSSDYVFGLWNIYFLMSWFNHWINNEKK